MTVLMFALKSLVLKLGIAAIKRFVFKIPKQWGREESTFTWARLIYIRYNCQGTHKRTSNYSRFRIIKVRISEVRL
jgi:hypothetical protein